jgi:hypothetical protein
MLCVRMPWSPEQIKTLYDNVYRDALACPACGGALTLERSLEPNTAGVVCCPACGERRLVSMHNDPLRFTFRAYTEAEKKEIVRADRARRTPVCPVDGTAMTVNLQRSLGRNSNAVIRCRRCARSVEYVRLHG